MKNEAYLKKKRYQYNQEYQRKKLEKDLERNYCRFHRALATQGKCKFKTARICWLMRQKENRGKHLTPKEPPKFWILGMKNETR